MDDASWAAPGRSRGRRAPAGAAVIAALLLGGVVAAGFVASQHGRSLPLVPVDVTAPAVAPDSVPAITVGDASVVDHDVPATTAATPARVHAAPTWVRTMSAATGIGAIATQAYADATLELAAQDPGCRLGWTTVAAIGGIESGHGTHGGSTLGADGRPTPAIVGPALDGRDGFAAIHASAAGTAWHGDTVWEHAVGPLQFLPSTWQRWGADGDGDGVADPEDINDAALAAGRYLCASGRDLTTGDNWWSAVLSYNHSIAYAEQVHAKAETYARASLAAVVPSGP